MGMYVRLNGELPKDVFDLSIVDEETAKQLALLQTMCANSADLRWINQEQVRLAGRLCQESLYHLRVALFCHLKSE